MPGRPHLSCPRAFRRPSPARAAAVLLVVGLLALTGCGGDGVSVGATHPTGSARADCRSLVTGLPHTVAGHARRHVHGSSYAGAWGDPAIVLRCGVPSPKGLTLTSLCQEIAGVGWFLPDAEASDLSRDLVLTTVDRRPRVEVRIPAKLRPSSAALVDLAADVKAHTTHIDACH